MAQIYLGGVRGTTIYTTCEQSTDPKSVTVQKTLISPVSFEPSKGDVVVFANGDARQVTFVDDLFVTCGEVKANFRTKQDETPVCISIGPSFAKN